MTLFAIAVLAGFALYVMTPTERVKLLGRSLGAVRQVGDAAVRIHQARDPFSDALDARTPWPVVTPALVLLNVAMFVRMLAGDGALANPDTLVGWGASFGPQTTNGEWWRLVTAMFVHSGFLHLTISLIGLAPLGLMLERLVGHCAFATVYAASGVFAGLASLSANPMAVSAGASGAIFGLYGLLLASAVWGIIRRSPFTVPLSALKKLAPSTAVFLLYNLLAGGFDGGNALNGLVMGFVCGAVLARGVGERKPPALQVGAAVAATAFIVTVAAVPMRGFIDVRPEIQRVVAIEDRTMRVYQAAVDQFRLGATTAEALAQLINDAIVPELRGALARIEALDGVPVEHKPLVGSAEEYLRLRGESWRLRAEGLTKHNMLMLQKADRTERASLDAFERIAAAGPHQ